MKKYKYINFIISILVLIFVLLSYYMKKRFGLILSTLIVIFIFVNFIVYSLFILCSQKKQYSIIIFQLLAVILFYLIFKFNLADTFALLIEVPKIERRVEKIKQMYGLESFHVLDDNTEIIDGYILFAWEPGFLDYQQVLVYDEKNDLKDVKNGKKVISIGKLYVLEKAKDCFYLCLLQE
ncbi:hypothetical protein [Treponema pedis]|uniref:hypothetical protein n=1 Tax=Treponema pedis TaxID=409322 RepID=UPI0004201553|nr:hypothetical protein [Treponema pedis]